MRLAPQLPVIEPTKNRSHQPAWLNVDFPMCPAISGEMSLLEEQDSVDAELDMASRSLRSAMAATQFPYQNSRRQRTGDRPNLEFVHRRVSLVVFNALDENGVTNLRPEGADFRRTRV